MGISISRILKCTGLSVILTALILFIISVLCYCTSLQESTLTILVYGSVVLCVFVGAFASAKMSESKPLINAFAISVFYYVILLILTIAINKTVIFNSHCLTMTAGIFAAGVLGAILGK